MFNSYLLSVYTLYLLNIIIQMLSQLKEIQQN